MNIPRICFGATLLLAGFLHAAQPAAAATQEVPATPSGLAAQAAVELGQLHDYVNAVGLANYVHAVDMAHVTDYVNAVAASEVQARVAAAPRPSYSAPVPSGGACGGASNGADQYIHRESGGDPYIVNGGGHAASPQEAGRAFGCYQILPSTWAGSCSDITTYDPASQARCASRLPDSAWAL